LRRILNCGKPLKDVEIRSADSFKLSDEQVITLSDIIENGGRQFTDKQLSEELIKRYPGSDPVCKSTICRTLHSPRMAKLVGREYTWKVASMRGPRANTPENKELRLKVTAELKGYLRKGKLWVSIDETHWDLQYGKNMAYAKRGDKAFAVAMPYHTQLTAIAAIDSNGRIGYVDIVKGKNTAQTFNAFFKTLVEEYKEEDVVFFLDNASIHRKEDLKCGEGYKNHAILFNAPYSEELNPIEMFFSSWKRLVSEKVKLWPGEHAFIEILKSTVMEIPKHEIRSEFSHVENEVFPKVVRMEDL